jgi:hypothetical protein
MTADNRRQPNETFHAETAHATFTAWPCEFIIVESASELPDAIKIGRTVELADPVIGSRFAAVQAWHEKQYWILSPLMVALLSFAIAQRYGIALSWNREWIIRKSYSGRIVLNPVERK